VRWDIVFFLKGYPAKYRFRDVNYFMIPVMAAELERLAEVERARFGDRELFFGPSKPEVFTAFGFRGEADDQDAAINRALGCLNGFLDGASLFMGHESPRIGPVLIRKPGDDDARLCLYFAAQWSYFDSHDEQSVAWEKQATEIYKQVWPFFDVVAGLHARSGTPLAQQLVYSMKMYRRGATTAIDGVEFICKWSALEGMVSDGGSPIRRTMIARLEALFTERKTEIECIVNKLWAIRNDVVHEAHAEGVVDAIQEVDRFFLGVAVFAIAHLDRANSLGELWAFAADYHLPASAQNTHPGRWRILSATMPAATARGYGKMIEELFATNARTLSAVNDAPASA